MISVCIDCHVMPDQAGQEMFQLKNFIGDRAVIDHTDARTGNHFVGFQLCFVNVIQDAFVWRNADEMVAELAISVFGGDDMFELHTLKCWVL